MMCVCSILAIAQGLHLLQVAPHRGGDTGGDVAVVATGIGMGWFCAETTATHDSEPSFDSSCSSQLVCVFPVKDPAFSLTSVLVATPVPEHEGPCTGRICLSIHPLL